MGPIGTINSGHNVAVVHVSVQNYRWGLGPIETFISGAKGAVLNAKSTDEGWDPQRLVILILITLFCMHQRTGDVWYPWSLVILLLITLFRMQITTGEVWDL